ncbi:C39 family peptidase [Kurthia huakuii]|uniref:C39 family peptidase n=1 Tax=Kurthia huakuii TaxID=1421019 RepID=UPI000496273F|nr:C39 family peptidase [Kurthia huakuii]MBM7698119.1 uncharacterized protein YvpB [Kurthia huakuii]
MKKSVKVGLVLGIAAGATALAVNQSKKNASPEPFVTFTDDTKLYALMDTNSSVTHVLPISTVVTVVAKKHVDKNLWFEVETPFGHGFILDETVLPQVAGAQHIELDVPIINQYAPVDAPFGCEGAALLMALHYKKYTEDSLEELLNNMPTAERNPHEGFVGSPYEEAPAGYYQTIYPAPLAAYAKERYAQTVEDISGSDIQAIRHELNLGNPVVLYVTEAFAAPIIGDWDFGTAGTEQAVDNLHIVLVTGYDSTIGEYKVADPSADEGAYWINGYALEKAYNAQQHAVVVR